MSRGSCRAYNADVSPPAPPHALFLECVGYPRELYLSCQEGA